MNSSWRKRLASLLKKEGATEEKINPSLMTWRKDDATPDSATRIMQKIFEAHKARKKVVHIRKLTIQAVPKYQSSR